jgi:hypothetical protein
MQCNRDKITQVAMSGPGQTSQASQAVWLACLLAVGWLVCEAKCLAPAQDTRILARVGSCFGLGAGEGTS